jgi:hypothetical protein
MYDIPFNEGINFSTYQIPIEKNFSMWHVGLHLLTSASAVYQNGAEISAESGDLGTYRYKRFLRGSQCASAMFVAQRAAAQAATCSKLGFTQ